MDIFKLGDKILALLEAVFGFWNNQISLVFAMLGQSPVSFKGGGPWAVIEGIEPVFVAVGSSLVVLFFVIGFCSESIDVKEEMRFESILRMLIRLGLAEWFVANNVTIMKAFFTSIGNLVGLISAGTTTQLAIDSTQADIIKELGFGESLVMLILTALLCACIAGLLAGLCTGLLHTKLGIPPILAGILTQIALYSINLNIMQRHANQALSADKYNLVLSSRNLTHAIIVGVIFSVVIIAVLYWYFGTEQGSAIRATGCNPAMSKAQGINIDNMKLIGLALSNAIVALSGGLLSQYSGFSDVNMGRGGIVIGLAAVIIGEVLGDAILGKHMNFMGKLIFVIFGGIVYYIVIGIVLWLQMPSDDLKLFTAIIVAIFLAVPYLKGKSKASFKKAGKRSAAALNTKEGK